MTAVTTIYDQAFYYNYYLQRVILPPTIKYLGNQVYRDDLKINEIVCLAEVPPTCDGNVFDTTYNGYDFSVVIGCADAYRKSNYFRDFAIHEDYYRVNTEFNADKGSVDVNGQGTVAYLDIWTDAEITLTPKEGEKITEVKVNGVDKTDSVVDGKLQIVPTEQNLLVQVVFGDGSGIDGIEADAQAVYYDLNGIRVDNPRKGLYIKVETAKGGHRNISKVIL